MQEIRVAIIGTGIIAHQHMEGYAKIPGVKVVAACDINAPKLEAFCAKYGIENQYADYRELLKRDDLDSVDVCLHNNLHAPIAIAVMAAGKNCYCEKPMAGSYVDAVRMQEAAKKYGVKLHIQLSMIYGGQVIAAKKLIAAGRLGHIYHARSYGYRRHGRPFVDGYAEKEFDSAYWAGHGALYDMGVYHISQLLYVLDTPKVVRVSGNVYQEMSMHEGRRQESGFSVEELGVGLVKFEDGLTMDILESWAIQGGEFPMSSIHGSLGGVQFTERGQSMFAPNKLKFFHEVEGYMADTLLDVGGQDFQDMRFDPTRMFFESSQNHWVAVLRDQVTPIDTPHIALQTMLVSEGIFLSSKLGREVAVEEIPEISQSIAVKEQDTPFGQLHYPPYPFFD